MAEIDATENLKTKKPDLSLPVLPEQEKPIEEIAKEIPDDIQIPPEQMPTQKDFSGADNYTLKAGDNTTSPAGEGFNPAIHVSPNSINKDGKFRRKKNTQGIAANDNPVAGQSASLLSPEQQARNAAMVVAGLFFGGGCMLCGPEFAPENKQEKSSVEDALANYFIASGVVDVPPGLALTITLAGYVAVKYATKPTVKKSLTEKVVDPIKKYFAKK